MAHTPVAELVSTARAIAKDGHTLWTNAMNGDAGLSWKDVETLASRVAGLGDNIEALLNDYTENGQTLTAPGSNQYVGEDGTLKTGDGTS